ncbi:MAG: nucleotidyltransferase family protein [Pseudomonadota bacterium]
MKKSRVEIAKEPIAEFCRRHGIQRLSLFGSVLTEDFNPESDVDVLIEFKPGIRVGMIRLAGLEGELSDMIGRKVDLNTPGFISKYFRKRVLSEREIHYAEA